MTLEEFVAAMHLVQQAAQGRPLPETLPPELLIKPSAPTVMSSNGSSIPSPGEEAATAEGSPVAEGPPDGTLDALLDGAQGFMESAKALEHEVSSHRTWSNHTHVTHNTMTLPRVSDCPRASPCAGCFRCVA